MQIPPTDAGPHGSKAVELLNILFVGLSYHQQQGSQWMDIHPISIHPLRIHLFFIQSTSNPLSNGYPVDNQYRGSGYLKGPYRGIRPCSSLTGVAKIGR